MKKELIFGQATDKERLLITPKNHKLISEKIGEIIIITKLFFLSDVPTVNTETGEESTYNTGVAVTDDNEMLSIPNAVALTHFSDFIDTIRDEVGEPKSITFIPKEIKSASGNKYIDVEITDFDI